MLLRTSLPTHMFFQWFVIGKRRFTKTGCLKHVMKNKSVYQKTHVILRGEEGADRVDVEKFNDGAYAEGAMMNRITLGAMMQAGQMAFLGGPRSHRLQVSHGFAYGYYGRRQFSSLLNSLFDLKARSIERELGYSEEEIEDYIRRARQATSVPQRPSAGNDDSTSSSGKRRDPEAEEPFPSSTGRDEDFRQEMQQMERRLIRWLTKLAKKELLQEYRACRTEIEWVKKTVRFYHAYVPFLQFLFSNHHETYRKASTTNVFVSHSGANKLSYAEPLTRYLQQKGVPDVFLDAQLPVGANPHDEILWAALTCRTFWCVLSKNFVQDPWPLRELMIGYVRYIQERDHGFCLLLDCIETGRNPIGLWMDRVLQMESLKLYNDKGWFQPFQALCNVLSQTNPLTNG